MNLCGHIDPFRLRQLVLRAAALLVPQRRRADWLAEWQAELWYIEHETPASSDRQALAFCLGAFKDGLWIKLHDPEPARFKLWLLSPAWCLTLLVVLASVLAAVLLFNPPAILSARIWLGHFFLLLTALVLLPATISLEPSEYPKSHESATRLARFRRWMFFGAKTGLLVTIVCCISLGAAGISVAGLHPHGALVGYILALRWSLIDQRRRCPVCLRLLTNPTRIGGASNTFLSWYGTELICGRGHGLLHVSEIHTSSYSAQRWLNLDSSWRGLFPPPRL